ncbi:MAG: hypothetical protein WCX48_06900 [Bacteroidales bacterium]
MFPQQIVEFIKEHHVLTLAAANGSDIWCSHAFYAFVEEELLFVITSEEKTRHIQLAIESGLYAVEPDSHTVAGAIALETEKVGMIRGLQFKAQISKCDDSYLNSYRLRYLKRFPYAILKGGDLWLLRLVEVKYTDNRLGFGKKMNWHI